MRMPKFPRFKPFGQDILQKWISIRAEHGLPTSSCHIVLNRFNNLLLFKGIDSLSTHKAQDFIRSSLLSFLQHHNVNSFRQIYLTAVMSGKAPLNAYPKQFIPRQYVNFERQRRMFTDKTVASDLMLFSFHLSHGHIRTLDWAEGVTNEFLSSVRWTKATTLGEVKFYVAYFIRWLSMRFSISDFNQIKPSQINAFFKFTLRTYFTNCISPFITFLVTKQVLPDSFIALSVSFMHNFIIDDEVEPTPPAKSEAVTPDMMFNSITMAIRNMEQLSFSRFSVEKIDRAVLGYNLFLHEHNVNASVKSINNWCRSIDHKHGKYTSLGVALFIAYMQALGIDVTAEHYRAFMRIKLKRPYYVQNWAQQELNAYHEECLKNNKRFIRSDINRLIVYMSSIGLKSFKDLNADILYDFALQDQHKTHRGKYRTLVCIRKFLIHLAEKHIIKFSTAYSLPAINVELRNPIQILSPDQVRSIKEFCQKKTDDERDNRLIWILSLALLTGLRKTDIINLKMENIDVDSMTINLIQKKTNVELRLPLPVEALDSLINYIKSLGDKADDNNIMLSMRAPHVPIEYEALAQRDIKKINAGYFTLHMLRKTFASYLLESGTSCIAVAQMLGHSDIKTIQKYLSSSEQRIRDCCLSLEDLDTEIF